MIFLCSQNTQDSVKKNAFITLCEPSFIVDYLNTSTETEFAVDTETEGLDPHTCKVTILQIGDSTNQFVIDCRYVDILLFKKFLESKKLLLHNSKFDYKMLKRSGIFIENIYDTMLAEAVLYCGYFKYGLSLKDLVERYCNYSMDKTLRGGFSTLFNSPLSLEQVKYAADDVTFLHQIKEKQRVRMLEYDLEYTVNLENNAIKALADIEYNGMGFNKKKWLENTKESELELIDLENTLDSYILMHPILQTKYPMNCQLDLFTMDARRLSINYSSPDQVLKMLKCLIPDIPDTNDFTLSKYKQFPIIELLQKYREVKTIVDRYGRSFLTTINKKTNRIHTDFWPVLNTGRISSGSSKTNSPNVQNIPADNRFRNCFIARPGFKWVSIDYSSQELRLMADGSGEEGFINALNEGIDLHCYAGSMMFKRTITKEDKDLRNKAKTINFGKPYGMGPPKLADTLKISIDEANDLFKEYALAFPKLNAWLDKQGLLGKIHGYSETFYPCKRKRFYPEIDEARQLRIDVQTAPYQLTKSMWKNILTIEGRVMRNSMNGPIQGSGADICKEALIAGRDLIDTYNKLCSQNGDPVAYLICTVHDALDFEVREDLAEQFTKEMCKLMIDCGNKYVTKVKMDVDPTITDYWIK